MICPSRGRPNNIAGLIDAWTDTGTKSTLLVCVDDNDPTLPQYRDAVGNTAELIVGPRRRLVSWLNHIAVQFADQFDAIGLLGDDVRPRTQLWDSELLGSLPAVGIVYGNDLHQQAALPTHPVLDAEIVRRLGYLAPPELTHLYPDNVWKAWGETLGRLVYRGDVVLEHMHPHAGKAEMDDLYREVNSRAAYHTDRTAFETYMRTRFDADVELLR